MQLSNSQKKFLRSIAHTIHPVVMIGANGLSENVQNELLSSLESHELLKIKIKIDKQEQEQIINSILEITEASLVQSIGNIIVIFKPFVDNPQIILPKK